MRIAGLALFGILVLAMAGCGGGGTSSDGDLHLATGTMTAADYRDSVRASLAGLGGLSECESLRGLSGAEAYRVMMKLSVSDITTQVADSDPDRFSGKPDLSQMTRGEMLARGTALAAYLSTVQAAQTQVVAIETSAYESDAARAGAIVQEECARVLNGK